MALSALVPHAYEVFTSLGGLARILGFVSAVISNPAGVEEKRLNANQALQLQAQALNRRALACHAGWPRVGRTVCARGSERLRRFRHARLFRWRHRRCSNISHCHSIECCTARAVGSRPRRSIGCCNGCDGFSVKCEIEQEICCDRWSRCRAGIDDAACDLRGSDQTKHHSCGCSQYCIAAGRTKSSIATSVAAGQRHSFACTIPLERRCGCGSCHDARCDWPPPRARPALLPHSNPNLSIHASKNPGLLMNVIDALWVGIIGVPKSETLFITLNGVDLICDLLLIVGAQQRKQVLGFRGFAGQRAESTVSVRMGSTAGWRNYPRKARAGMRTAHD